MACTYLQKNVEILAMKTEGATPGTAATIADADFNIRVRNVEFTPTIEMDDENSKFATGDHGEDLSIPGAQMAQISFQVKMAWEGTDEEVAPNWWKALLGCGAVTTAKTTTGIVAEPLAAGDCQTYTIEWMVPQRGATPAAVKFQLAGAMGNCVFSCEGTGKPWMAQFTYTGKLTTVADVANGNILTLTAPSTVVAETALDNPITLIGVSGQKASSWSLDIGNDIQPVIDQSDATGYSHFAIAARRPRMTINPLMRLVATDPIYTKWAAGTEGACSIASASSSPNFTLHVPVGQILNAPVGNREGLLSWESLSIKCNRNGTASSDIADEAGWQLLQKAYA